MFIYYWKFSCINACASNFKPVIRTFVINTIKLYVGVIFVGFLLSENSGDDGRRGVLPALSVCRYCWERIEGQFRPLSAVYVHILHPLPGLVACSCKRLAMFTDLWNLCITSISYHGEHMSCTFHTLPDQKKSLFTATHWRRRCSCKNMPFVVSVERSVQGRVGATGWAEPEAAERGTHRERPSAHRPKFEDGVSQHSRSQTSVEAVSRLQDWHPQVWWVREFMSSFLLHQCTFYVVRICSNRTRMYKGCFRVVFYCCVPIRYSLCVCTCTCIHVLGAWPLSILCLPDLLCTYQLSVTVSAVTRWFAVRVAVTCAGCAGKQSVATITSARRSPSAFFLPFPVTLFKCVVIIWSEKCHRFVYVCVISCMQSTCTCRVNEMAATSMYMYKPCIMSWLQQVWSEIFPSVYTAGTIRWGKLSVQFLMMAN